MIFNTEPPLCERREVGEVWIAQLEHTRLTEPRAVLATEPTLNILLASDRYMIAARIERYDPVATALGSVLTFLRIDLKRSNQEICDRRKCQINVATKPSPNPARKLVCELGDAMVAMMLAIKRGFPLCGPELSGSGRSVSMECTDGWNFGILGRASLSKTSYSWLQCGRRYETKHGLLPRISPDHPASGGTPE